MIHDEKTAAWCAQRMGESRTNFTPERLRRRAYELNTGASEFIDTFGQREFRSFIGFIDLVRFTTRVQGQAPSKIEEYLKPFFENTIGILRSHGAMIDKTIGDEIMFCLPDNTAETGVSPWNSMGRILNALYEYVGETSGEYPLRLGLAYGSLRISKLKGEGYSEYTTFGETVHLAKRLHTVDGIEGAIDRFGIGGAFGILQREEDSKRIFEVILSYIAGVVSKMTYEEMASTIPLKGVDPYYGAILLPRSNTGGKDG